MAENKKSFILYTDLIHTVKKLPDEKAGQLFKHLLEYVNDLDPVTDDFIIDLTFEPIKQQLKRDLKKYEGYIDKQKLNGAKGGRPKKPKKPNPLNDNPKNPSEPKKPDSVNVSVNDTVNENDKNTIYSTCVEFWLKEFHIGWTFTATHGKKMRSIISKLTKLHTEPTDQKVIDTFKAFCLKLPEWYQDKDLATLDSKFNEIITEIKNGKQTTKGRSIFAPEY